jgi:cytochrome c-type biogenesis protein CcmE
MKKRLNMYIFILFSLILTFNIVSVSANESLKLYKISPEITNHSIFIQLTLNR